MSKRLKRSGAAYLRQKTNREEILTTLSGSIDAYAKSEGKIGRGMKRKIPTSRKNKTHNWQWNTRPIWVF